MWRLTPWNPALRKKRQAGFWIRGYLVYVESFRPGRAERRSTNYEPSKSNMLCCCFQVLLQGNVNKISINHCTGAPTSEMFLKDTNRLKSKDQKQCALLSLVKRKPRAAQTLTKVDLRAKNIPKNSHAVTLNESLENTLLNVYLLVTDPKIYWELTEYKENLDKHGIGDKPVIPALGGSKAETLGVQGHPRAAWAIKSHPSWGLVSKNKNNTKYRQINSFQRLIPLFREWQKRQAESQQGHRQHSWPAYPPWASWGFRAHMEHW